ncbi:MAG: RluA family pseudouridine synthase [Bdellovibrionota bacterium]
MKFEIIHETDKFVAVNKPAGILSQKDKSGDDDLAALLAKEWKTQGKKVDFLAPVHRLDRNVSGLILLAKSSAGAKELSAWLVAGKINRTYLAIAKGDPGAEGKFEFRLKKDSATNEVRVTDSGDEAITEFTRLQKLGNSCLMKVRLLTGRSHQIRVHFSHAGHALLGDKKYAKKPWSEIFQRPALHAAELEMPGKNGELLRLQAPTPKDFNDLLLKLGGKPV